MRRPSRAALATNVVNSSTSLNGPSRKMLLEMVQFMLTLEAPEHENSD